MTLPHSALDLLVAAIPDWAFGLAWMTFIVIGFVLPIAALVGVGRQEK